jgi:hypothetical protein
MWGALSDEKSGLYFSVSYPWRRIVDLMFPSNWRVCHNINNNSLLFYTQNTIPLSETVRLFIFSYTRSPSSHVFFSPWSYASSTLVFVRDMIYKSHIMIRCKCEFHRLIGSQLMPWTTRPLINIRIWDGVPETRLVTECWDSLGDRNIFCKIIEI